MLLSATLLLAALAALARAQPKPANPINLKRKATVTLKPGSEAAVVREANGNLHKIDLPVLIDELTATIDNYDGREYWACLKQAVALPATAEAAAWTEPGQCELFKFKNGTASPRVNMRAGTYYMTVMAAKALKKNVTLDFTFAGKRCENNGAPNKKNNCQKMKVIMPDVPTSVAGDPNTLYVERLPKSQGYINSTTGAVTLKVGFNGATANQMPGAILARWGAPPTVDIYDVKIMAKKNKTITASVPSPRMADWYFGFQALNGTGNTTFVTQVEVSFNYCKAGMFGADCKLTATPLKAAGTEMTAEGAKGKPVYYSFHKNDTKAMDALLSAANANTSLAVAAGQFIEDAANQTAPQVYARLGGLPSADTYDIGGCTASKCPTAQTTLFVPQENVGGDMDSDMWYVAVVPGADGNVVTWNAAGGACADDCHSAGTCDHETAICTCEGNYVSFNCGETGSMPAWEWALIIGGALLIAIGLIGCIVYFIQKNQRRSGFERV